MSDNWRIVANVADANSGARKGALCDILQIAVPRVYVEGLSVGGRRIKFWTETTRLTDWRVKWCAPVKSERLGSPMTWDDKNEAQQVAAALGNTPA